MLNFSDAANKPLNEIERPPLLPAGTYRFMVERIPGMEESSDKKFDFVDFPLKLVQPMEDVDTDALAAFGKLDNVRMRHRFIFDREDENRFKQSLFNVKRFIEEHLQVDGAALMPLKQALNQTVNHQCLATIRWNPDKNDKELFYANIAKTAPVG